LFCVSFGFFHVWLLFFILILHNKKPKPILHPFSFCSEPFFLD
jgi:hypothetical protein